MISSRSRLEASRRTRFSSSIKATFASSTTVDVGIGLWDLAVLGCKGVRLCDAGTRDPMHLHEVWFALARDRAFHGVQDVHQSVHIAGVYPPIPAGRQRAAGQKVNIGVLTSDEEDPFS